MQLRDGLHVIGPAFLVSVAYLDPGNWATAIESGSRFGYDQLWILVLSNVIAIHLQALSARLGLASGRHLAQVCRDSYPPAVCRLLWLMTEASIVALDLTMVLGTAIGLNLLFKIPPVTCILLTALDALALFLLFPQTALRQAEQWTAMLVFAVLACFVIDLFISKPPLRSVLLGFYPTLHRDDIYSAVSLLGANVMPHNFYLHSALVAGQSSRNNQVTARRCYLNSLDIACALGLALLVNVAVLLVAASTFHSAGVQVTTLQEAHDLLEQILNSRTAPLAFGLALLLTGQMSTFTSTIAGQVVMSGFVGATSSTLGRRLTTRALAIAPALLVQLGYGAEGTYRMLVIAQVVLAMQLPFTLIPLIKSTSSAAIMGDFASSWIRSSIAWAASFVVFTANMLMFVDMLWMETPEQVAAREEEQGFADKGFDEWLAHVMDVLTRSPGQFLATCLVAGLAMMAMALLMWMSVHPVRVKGSLRAKKVTASSVSDEDDGHSDGRCVDEDDNDDDDLERAMHALTGQKMSQRRPSAVNFVNLLFSDLPMKHLRRFWKTVHTQPDPIPAQHPLTQALLDQHTKHSAGFSAAVNQQGIQPDEDYVPRVLLDWRSQQQRRMLWQRACEEMQRAEPSEYSLSSFDGIQSVRSVQTAVSTASEPGGGKGHRLGRASRRTFANLVCAIFGRHWDTHGVPVAHKQAGLEHDYKDVQPLIFRNANETMVELCDAVVEVMSIHGMQSMLQQKIPTSLRSQNSGRPMTPSGLGLKADHMASLGPRLELCSELVQALRENAEQLREAYVTAQEEVDVYQDSLCSGKGWSSVLHILQKLWPGVVQFSKPSDCSDSVVADAIQGGYVSGIACLHGITDKSNHPRQCRSSKQHSTSPIPMRGTAVGGQYRAEGDCVPRLCFLGFCIWCMAALLQLATVEPRPELWGRYVAALNHLQGPLHITLNLAENLQGSSHEAAGVRGKSCTSDLATFGLAELHSERPKVLQSLRDVHAELMQLLNQVEAHVSTCGASHASNRTAGAFAKGKFNIVSLIKRLRANISRRNATVPPQPIAGASLHVQAYPARDSWRNPISAPRRTWQAYSMENRRVPTDHQMNSAGSWRSSTPAQRGETSVRVGMRDPDNNL